MSKPSFIKIIITVVIILIIFGVSYRICPECELLDAEALPSGQTEIYRTAVKVPAGIYRLGSREVGCYPVRDVALPAFYIWPYEVPWSWWQEFAGQKNVDRSSARPATSMTHEQAQDFCRWFSKRYDVVARLPTVDEWEAAARAGKVGIPYPWGWGGPRGRAVLDAEVVSEVISFSPNSWGLYHMSGNAAEWCAGNRGEPRAPVMGGSWTERDEAYLRISHRLLMPPGYRDADVGFRIVIEMPAHKETVALTTSNRE